ncbi:MAG TPA: ATP-dependent DNA helicase RecG [Caldithrix abyssi]|uniref:ATP-dependent DNA helicase RecG n=1 Tax=Caldithrix abyssi TaxID=187145 RepID=A0A7V4U2D9_CALAY|nr:ATP-dependent DNA helicase RecG [Caldithrix abyssi]
MSPTKPQEYELQYLKGIGPKRAEILARQGIRTFDDLINFFPRKYVDRRQIVPLDKLEPDQEITVVGKVETAGVKPTRKRIFYIVISDGHGLLEAVWFNSIEYYRKLFHIGEWVSLSGKVGFYRGFQMVHPDYDRLGEGEFEKMLNTGKILPFYPENETFRKTHLNSYFFRWVFANAVSQFEKKIPEVYPPSILRKNAFIPRWKAYRAIHLPETSEELDEAVRRFKYEDFFQLQLMLALQRMHFKEKSPGIAFTRPSPLLEKLYRSLPFELTGAQKKVMHEIRADMKRPEPMNRLLQGDVGSGKTLVAVMSMLIAVDNGYQAALMVPTEILAEQHYLNISKMLEPLGVKVSLLTGGSSAQQRRELAAELDKAEPHIVIGTHALIQDAVGFKKLGLVVIDEQHRFGVMQRAKLVEKGMQADTLVMTATPIPRTLALTVYGSLDVSIIDEMPANRKPIVTVWRFDDKAADIYAFIRERLDRGEQAYIVYPLVEESEKLDLKAATEGFKHLVNGPFKGYKPALLHGRMNAAQKESVMSAFVAGEVQVLVATTVIEVGVDVANATIMLIEHAERFGLSQLHQLRGRVGRGEKKSYCILKTPYNIGEVAQQRMKIMTETNDGFIIAEKDLELRGWGDFFGTKQSGIPRFKLANPIADRDILETARQDAFELVQADPFLRSPENAPLTRYFKKHLKGRMELSKIG